MIWGTVCSEPEGPSSHAVESVPEELLSYAVEVELEVSLRVIVATYIENKMIALAMYMLPSTCDIALRRIEC